MCAFSGHAGADAGRCCKVLLEGDVLLSERWVRLRAGMLLDVTCALWSWCPAVQGAAAKCCLRVLLLELRVCCGAGPPVPLHGALQGTGAGYYCRRAVCIGTWESAVCAMKLGCWCRGRGWLRDVNGSVGVGP